MLDKIEDIIKDIASDKDKDGNIICTYEDIENQLISLIHPFKHYIIKFHSLNITGKKFANSYSKWQEKHKDDGQSFGNYVEQCINEEEHKKAWERWMSGTGVFDCNNVGRENN